MTAPGSAFHLAQVNIGRARGEMTDPVMADFAAALPAINALAERTPGFVRRLQTEDGDATAIRPYEDNRILINLSVLTDLAALGATSFRATTRPTCGAGASGSSASSGSTWPSGGFPPGHRPSVAEAADRLAHLEAHGPTNHAFGFATPFGPEGLPIEREAGADDTCPAV